MADHLQLCGIKGEYMKRVKFSLFLLLLVFYLSFFCSCFKIPPITTNPYPDHGIGTVVAYVGTNSPEDVIPSWWSTEQLLATNVLTASQTVEYLNVLKDSKIICSTFEFYKISGEDFIKIRFFQKFISAYPFSLLFPSKILDFDLIIDAATLCTGDPLYDDDTTRIQFKESILRDGKTYIEFIALHQNQSFHFEIFVI